MIFPISGEEQSKEMMEDVEDHGEKMEKMVEKRLFEFHVAL